MTIGVSRAPTRTSSSDGRSGAGPVRSDCEVLSLKREGAYWVMSLAAPDIAERAKPGQFIDLSVRAQATILRRPFSIYRVSRKGAYAGTVDFVFDAHGPGTEWLSHVGAHDTIDAVGPLGHAFPMPQQHVPCLLVGGGYGVAPLFFLADELGALGMRVDMVVGAASQDRIFNAIEAKRVSAAISFTTEDGTMGHHGMVTDVLDRAVSHNQTRAIYACGPMPMLQAVSLRAKQLGVPCQIAVEEHMACGVGVCWTCVIPLRTKDGAIRMKRSCIDGPVFSGANVAWDLTRWHTPRDEPEPQVEGEDIFGMVGDAQPLVEPPPGVAP